MYERRFGRKRGGDGISQIAADGIIMVYENSNTNTKPKSPSPPPLNIMDCGKSRS